MTKKALILAGGTGGHIIPGLAVGKELQQKGFEVEWLGTRAGLEANMVPQAGLPIHYITVTGLRGKRLSTLLLAPFRLFLAFFQTLKIFRQVKPDLVVGMGGFVSGPGGIVAWLKRIPLVLHEQNAVAGTTNRILSRFADVTLEAFPNSFPSHSKVILTGNPVRRELLKILPPRERYPNTSQLPFKILVLGGSRGASCLNEKLPTILISLFFFFSPFF